jgi:hypothetical protein
MGPRTPPTVANSVAVAVYLAISTTRVINLLIEWSVRAELVIGVRNAVAVIISVAFCAERILVVVELVRVLDIRTVIKDVWPLVAVSVAALRVLAVRVAINVVVPTVGAGILVSQYLWQAIGVRGIRACKAFCNILYAISV